MVTSETVAFFNGELKPESQVGISIRDRATFTVTPYSTPPGPLAGLHSSSGSISTASTTPSVTFASTPG